MALSRVAAEPANPYGEELTAAIDAARGAGAIIADYYERAAAEAYVKGDGSPVTDADLAADRAIREVLSTRFPNDAILSEEGSNDERRLRAARCWIVDPLDGTEQFIARTGEFDVLVALAVDGRPVVAAGYQPTTGVLVTAVAGHGAWRQNGDGLPATISLHPASTSPRIATSKWFGAPENAAIVSAIASRASASLYEPLVTGFSPRMFLSPREIDAMVGIRPGAEQTMASEWDFAVTDLVIHEAGGMVTDLAGNQLRYNKSVPRNVGGLVAAVDAATHERVLRAAQAEWEQFRESM